MIARMEYVFGALAFAALLIGAPGLGYRVESRGRALAAALVLVAITFWLPSGDGTGEDYRPLIFLPWVMLTAGLVLLGRAVRLQRA